MIDFYTWSTPNGYKISIALEELGLKYRVFPINITTGDQFQPQFLKISPNNKIPAIVDHKAGVTMMESGAILLYLAEKHGQLLTSTETGKWQVIQWLMWQMSGFGPILGQTHHFLKFEPGKAPHAEERFKAETNRLYSVLDKHLSETDYLASEYSIADIAIWPWVSRYEWQNLDLNNFPAVKKWYQRIAEREAVQRGYKVPNDQAIMPTP